MDTITIIMSIVTAGTTVVIAVGGAWVTVKMLLTQHDAQIIQIREELKEMKIQRDGLQEDIKKMFILISEIKTNIAVLSERSNNK